MKTAKNHFSVESVTPHVYFLCYVGTYSFYNKTIWWGSEADLMETQGSQGVLTPQQIEIELRKRLHNLKHLLHSPTVDQHGCTANQVYVNCAFNCPTDYCPRSDGPVPQCSPPSPCRPGCRCKVNHRIHPDGQCRRSDLCRKLA